MGMDVYGRKPKNEKGEYFRNNLWWWRPLWGYVEDNYPEIAEKVPYAHSNDGDGLNSVQAKILANKLKADLKSGKVKRYETEYKAYVESLPMEDCQYCETTGKRAWNATHFAVSESVKQDPNAEMNDKGEYILECNSCKGLGKVEHFLNHYPFAEENVKEFAEFLENSGGFSIY